jgi:hypothetical protein
MSNLPKEVEEAIKASIENTKEMLKKLYREDQQRKGDEE